MSSLPNIQLSDDDVAMYNESVRKFEELHNHDMEMTKRDIEIQDLTSRATALQSKLDKMGEYDTKGRMLTLIERKCEEHEGIREQWTDFLMTLKLTFPDIEAEFKSVHLLQ